MIFIINIIVLLISNDRLSVGSPLQDLLCVGSTHVNIYLVDMTVTAISVSAAHARLGLLTVQQSGVKRTVDHYQRDLERQTDSHSILAGCQRKRILVLLYFRIMLHSFLFPAENVVFLRSCLQFMTIFGQVIARPSRDW